MTRANVARRQGDDFQARLFWLKATSLLDPKSPTIKVAYETGPKSFDDILIEYDPSAAPPDHEGQPIYRRHIQCKWHTTAGTFGYEDLTDPAFVNAERYSLLQRAHTAQSLHAPDGFGCRFELVTNWRLRPGDPLIELVRKESDALDLDRLFDGTTDRSRMGQVRRQWREHLEVDHATLRLVARVLALAEMPESLRSLRERLDEKFAAVGMKRVPATDSSFIYDDLIVKLLAQGRIEFDRESFRTMCQQEGLLEPSGQPQDVLAIGIRSFMHPIDNLEDRCERMLNLVPYFDGRYIRHETDWQHRILPELRDFVLQAARSTARLRLILDTHVSLAFAVGMLLNVKSGKRIDIEQRTDGRRFWSRDDEAIDPSWPKCLLDEEVLDDSQDEVVLAIGLTHDTTQAVRAFVTPTLHQVGRILHCRPEGGASQQSVRCGRHAWMLAEAVVQRLQDLRGSGRSIRRVHVFIAGPNGFAFFLGQHQQAIGPAAVYEWDFDGQRGGGYSLGLSLDGYPR
jgi:hypothetical protein